VIRIGLVDFSTIGATKSRQTVETGVHDSFVGGKQEGCRQCGPREFRCAHTRMSVPTRVLHVCSADMFFTTENLIRSCLMLAALRRESLPLGAPNDFSE
jgi:hypothetical protein